MTRLAARAVGPVLVALVALLAGGDASTFGIVGLVGNRLRSDLGGPVPAPRDHLVQATTDDCREGRRAVDALPSDTLPT